MKYLRRPRIRSLSTQIPTPSHAEKIIHINYWRLMSLSMSAVSEIMSERKIVSLDAASNPSLLDATKLMLKNRIGSVVLVNRDNRPVGIVTERDVLRKVSGSRRKLAEIKVREAMSSPVTTVRAFDSIDTAAEAMARKKIKRLVVVEQDGSMAGIVSLTDITRKLAKILTDEQNRYGKLKAILEGQ